MQLAQAQKMEAVGSLSGGLAHDFNNILTGIMGSSSLLELELDDINVRGGNVDKYLTMIKESSHKAADIVRKLLTLTRKTDLTFSSVDLNASLKNVIDICMNSFPKSVGIEVKYFDTPALVKADQSSLEQVFLNLFVNASHAVTTTEKAGEDQCGVISVNIVRYFADEVFSHNDPEVEKGSYYFAVSVHDNGCGIESENLDKIFDPFFTTKADAGGSGLGLSMVYNITKAHKGMIKVYSEKMKGSTFIVYLPEYTGDVDDAPKSDNAIIQGSGRILVVDDEEFVRDIARNILEKIGYEVMTASDGREGIELYRAHQGTITAVLLDMSMPGLSGLETFKQLKEINSSVEVLLSSGFSMDERVQSALNMGVGSFIQKPYTNYELSRAIHELTDKK